MNFVQYDKHAAATHEMGHATIACIAQLDFDYVEIRADPLAGWAGKCKLTSPERLSPIEQDAFQMGGALMQICYRGDSLGEFAPDFVVSIFEHAQALSWPTDERLRKLSWHYDLYDMMPAAQSLKRSAAPDILPSNWLLTLETSIREVFGASPIKEFVNAVAARLVERHSIESKIVRHNFDDTVPPEIYSDLVQFLKKNKQP